MLCLYCITHTKKFTAVWEVSENCIYSIRFEFYEKKTKQMDFIILTYVSGNINEAGKINLARLEKYLAALAEVEFEIFQDNHADLKYFEAKLTKVIFT